MDLKGCTKADLIWIINRMRRYDIGSHAYDHAIRDLEYEKEDRQLREAAKQTQIAYNARQTYFELLKPYEGKKILEIPDDILKKAADAQKRAHAADQKYLKLMKIE